MLRIDKSLQPPIGFSDFRQIIREGYLLVDKSLLIKEIIHDNALVVLITRPRRWGKSLNLSMLNSFFTIIDGENNKQLFNKSKIIKESDDVNEHQGKYPTVYLNLKDISGNDCREMIYQMGMAISLACDSYAQTIHTSNKLSQSEKELFDRFINLKATHDEIKNGLLKITRILFKHYSKEVLVFIDEYDTPINHSYNKTYFDEFSNFIKAFLSSGLKDNTCLKKAVMTGILRISKNDILSDLNNLEVYTVLNDRRYNLYFGFTESEVTDILRKTKPNEASNKRKNEVTEWYNGYKTVDGVTIYNPWSVMEYIKHEEARTYWEQTGSIEGFIKQAIVEASPETKKQFLALIANGTTGEIEVDPKIRYEDIGKKENALWSLLLFTGYLSLSGEPCLTESRYKLRIPNKEVKTTYTSVFKEWPEKNIPKEYQYTALCSDLVNGDFGEFSKKVNHCLLSVPSMRDFTIEGHYHAFMLGLLSSIQDTHLVSSNRESGFGYPDVLIVPDPNRRSVIKRVNFGIILEFKHVKDNQKMDTRLNEGLKQINVTSYTAELSKYTHITEVAKVSIAFKDRSMELKYELETLHRDGQGRIKLGELEEEGESPLEKKEKVESNSIDGDKKKELSGEKRKREDEKKNEINGEGDGSEEERSKKKAKVDKANSSSTNNLSGFSSGIFSQNPVLAQKNLEKGEEDDLELNNSNKEEKSNFNGKFQ